MFAAKLKISHTLQKNKGLPGVLLSFILGCAAALALFLPFLIVDKGFFLYCGDFNEQQIPFYMYVQGFLKEGGGTYSWATDLGSSVVNGYSFYNLGSPFLWLTLPLPNAWMPFMMVPLLCLKFGCMAAAAYLFLARYAKTRNIPVIVSLIYAFSGFNVYNIFFNHMLEPAIIFPLMLWALDGFIYEDRRGLFALFVGLSLINSYFFFLGNVTFILLYFFIKLLCKEYRLSLPRFGALAFEAVLGVGIGMVLALPSVLNLMQNPRVDNFASGMGLVLYGNVQQYFHILTSLLFPPDPPYIPNLFTEGVIKWTSMSAFLPIVGIAGVLAYAKSRKGGSIKKLLIISLIMAMVPVLNSSFYAFNASYYARWYYMPILIMALATLRSLEDADIDLAGGIRWALIFTGVYAIFGLLPKKTDDTWTLGVAQDARKFWLSWLTAMLSLAIFAVIVHFYRYRRRFAPLLLAAVMGFSVFYSVVHISLGKFPQWYGDADYRAMQYDGSYHITLPENEGFYRIDTFNAHDNSGLWLNRSSIRTFNSTVSPSIMEFYPFVGVTRDVSSKPDPAKYALRGLLSVRYTLVPHSEEANYATSAGTEGWVWKTAAGPYDIYENENFVPLGFTYDEYIPMSYLEEVRVDDRAALLMRGIGLSEEQEAVYSHLFSGTAVQYTAAEGSGKDTGGEPLSGWYQYDPISFERYVEDCNARRASASYQTGYDASGFWARIRMEKDNLVFFSVPYDEGFTATVNGQEAEVLKVSSGMMAIFTPAGDNEIIFTYHTPGLAAGAFISIGSLLLLALYLLLHFYYKKRTAPSAPSHGTPLDTSVRASQNTITTPRPPVLSPDEASSNLFDETTLSNKAENEETQEE